jgi:putative membrane protein
MQGNLFTRSLLIACAAVCMTFSFASNASADTGDHDVSGDEAFIATAAQGGMGEIELSRVAARGADSTEVRNFATKMVEEHTASNAELGKIAMRANLPMPVAPDSDHMQLRDKLIALRGPEFDKTYMEAMRSDHQKTVDFLIGASTMVTTDDLRNFIKKTLPVVQQHLRMAQDFKAS